jgi:hypothetical protein
LNEILDSKEPFTQEQFTNQLKSTKMSDKDYSIYQEDFKNYSSRWDYLVKYNIKDVTIMIEPINKLLKLWSDLGIDMFNALSLSGNANTVKHKVLYNDFSPNGDYSQKDDSPIFKPTLDWAKKKGGVSLLTILNLISY